MDIFGHVKTHAREREKARYKDTWKIGGEGISVMHV